ncbi:MAG: hypothetical protein Q8L85_07405 [Alphaproteobacteria bacterium]|nr:hypothetical protein [Alphaproteobacteria bacterium]
MRKHVVLFILMLTSFNVSAQFDWPIFSNKDDPKHCSLGQLNYEATLEKKRVDYQGQSILFTIKNYAELELGHYSKAQHAVLMQAYNPKTKTYGHILNGQLISFESTEYELWLKGNCLYDRIVVEKQIIQDID